MKRVICLYRVSTLGQVDHDDIPMQRLACHEYAATHPDWEIVDEISEKGVSGYKVSTNARDAIVEIKKRAVTHQFDVLLVFMFDRLGRREDETPFVVQWFAQQGIEVWSTREGEQRFDTHVDKLLNYIRFWQASGESEKTSIRVKTKHTQMVQEGLVPGRSYPIRIQTGRSGPPEQKEQTGQRPCYRRRGSDNRPADLPPACRRGLRYESRCTVPQCSRHKNKARNKPLARHLCPSPD